MVVHGTWYMVHGCIECGIIFSYGVICSVMGRGMGFYGGVIHVSFWLHVARLGGKESFVVSITVSNPTNTNGDALTEGTTRDFNFVCISANTLCETINLGFSGYNFGARLGYGVSRVLEGASISVHFMGNRRHMFLSNISIGGRVHAPGTSVVTSTISTGDRIESFLLRVREGLTERGGILVSNESVKAIILPGTAIGVFLATSSRTHTRHHCSRLGTGNVGIACGRICSSVMRQSCGSSRHRVTPLGRTSSTILTSAAVLSPRRSLRLVVGVVGSEV